MLKSLQTVFSDKKYQAIAGFSALALMALYFVSFSSIVLKQFGILADQMMLTSILSGSLIQLVLIGMLTITFGVWVAMQVYVQQRNKRCNKMSMTTASSSVFGGFLGGLGAFGSCPACLAIIAGVIGVNAAAFLLRYKTSLIIVAISLSILSIYMTSKSIKKNI